MRRSSKHNDKLIAAAKYLIEHKGLCGEIVCLVCPLARFHTKDTHACSINGWSPDDKIHYAKSFLEECKPTDVLEVVI